MRHGTCAGIGYQVAGMQSLVSAVRSTGARNVLMHGQPTGYGIGVRRHLRFLAKSG